MSANQSIIPDPESLAAKARAFLQSEADPVRARSNQRYFKDPVPTFGVTTPSVRRFAAELARRVRPAWSLQQVVLFCDRLMREPQVEAKAVGLLVLQDFGPEYPVSLLKSCERWLRKWCGNWATVDLLAPQIVGPLLDRHPEQIPRIEGWTGSASLWLRRAAAVALVPHARRGRHLGASYRIVRSLLDDREDLIHKATGWLLREAGATDPDRLERFLLRHGFAIPRTTLRYAIEHFGKADRQRLLRATRAPGARRRR